MEQPKTPGFARYYTAQSVSRYSADAKTSSRTPTYRKRKGHTQSLVTLRDALTGQRKDFWLGEAMIVGDQSSNPPRTPWSRKYINQQMQRIRRMFRWGASYEMVPSSVYQALDTVESLKRGRT